MARGHPTFFMATKEIHQLTISTWNIIKFFLVLFVIASFYIVRDILISLIFAIIVASAMEPGIEWLKRYKIPRILGVVLIYLSVALFMAVTVYLVFPIVYEEFAGISLKYPILQKQVLLGIEQLESLPLVSFFSGDLRDLIDFPANFVGRIGGGIFNAASNIFGGVLSFVLIIVFSFYLAAQEKGIESFLRLVTPLEYELYTIEVWTRSQRKLGKWLRAQLVLAAIVGVLIFFGLTFLGIENALLFALLSALFEIVPVVGPILAAVPAVAVAFFSSPIVGIETIALYTLVQQIESHVVVPVVMRKAVGLSPLVVLLALLFGAKLGGIFGILLAVPIASIFAEFVSDWDKKKRALLPE